MREQEKPVMSANGKIEGSAKPGSGKSQRDPLGSAASGFRDVVNQDAASRKSGSMSVRSRGSFLTKPHKLYYEDPASVLNPTEQQWNDIVMENRRQFEQEKVTVIQEKFQKLKKI